MKDTVKIADYLSIGQVLRPQGLNGAVKVRADTSDPSRFLTLKSVYITNREGQYDPVSIHDISIRSNFVYLTFEEDKDIQAAQARRDLYIYVDREDAVPLNEHENYIADMIGCELKDTKGALLGTLTDILQPGAADIYVVKTIEGTLLIPAVKHVILTVDVKNKTIIADENRLSEVSVLEN